MFKVITCITTLVFCMAAHAESPPCLPAALALAGTPVGIPVPANTYFPTISSAPIQDGLAVFWHCKVGSTIKLLEVHGTPQAIAKAGGLQAMQTLYLANKDEAWGTLAAIRHGCVDPAPNPHQLASRADCYSVLATDAHAKQYVCLNPAVTDPQEAKLCKQLLNDVVLQWPQ